MSKRKHGGKRKGAGRKPSGKAKVPRSIKLEPVVDEYLRQCDNATETIEVAVKRSKAFKDWQSNK